MKRSENQRAELVRDVATVLNKQSAENCSNTPDFILAEVMVSALEAFEDGSRQRERWYGSGLSIGRDQPPWVSKGVTE